MLELGARVDALPGSTGLSLPSWLLQLPGEIPQVFYTQVLVALCPGSHRTLLPSTWTQPPLERIRSWFCPGPPWLLPISHDCIPFSGLGRLLFLCQGLPTQGQHVTDTAQVKARPCYRQGNCGLWRVSLPSLCPHGAHGPCLCGWGLLREWLQASGGWAVEEEESEQEHWAVSQWGPGGAGQECLLLSLSRSM